MLARIVGYIHFEPALGFGQELCLVGGKGGRSFGLKLNLAKYIGRLDLPNENVQLKL